MMDTNNYRDRQLILRAFQAAGDTPSTKLLKLIPATIQGVLADPHSSTRDRVRAAECVMAMQKIQLSMITTVNSIKIRRDRRRTAAPSEPGLPIGRTADPEIEAMLAELEPQR